MSLVGSLINALSQGRPVERDTPAQLRAEVMTDMVIDPDDTHADRDLARALRVPRRDLTGAIAQYIRTKRLPGLRDSLQVDAVDHHGRTANHGAGLALAPGTMTTAAAHYVRGDYHSAAQALVDGIQDAWYHRQYAGTLARERKE